MDYLRIRDTNELRHALRGGRFAWPGGYPCFFVVDDGEALSFKAVLDNYREVADSVRNQHNDGWRVVGIAVNYEDPQLYCAHSGERIESAYAEDD